MRTVHKLLKALKLLPKTILPKTFKELESYPDRPPRDDDTEYKMAHHTLVFKEKHPCWLCGKTLDKAQAEGNTLETHHFAEQSLWHKFSPSKVYVDIQKMDFHGHAKDLPTNPETLTANHIANLVVLCSPCHRENGYGMHGATGPFVMARRWLKDPSDDVLKRWKPLVSHLKSLIKPK